MTGDLGLARNRERAHSDDADEYDHREHTNQTQFFGDHRHQEIGMRRRQIRQLLHARAEADTEPFAATESDERLHQLKTAIERIGPRIEKAGDAIHAIRRDQRQYHHAADAGADDQHEMPEAHAAQEQHRQHSDADDDDAAEIRLAQQQHANDGDDDADHENA